MRQSDSGLPEPCDTSAFVGVGVEASVISVAVGVSAACARTGTVEKVNPPQVRTQNIPRHIAIL
jgi:hypothetical protein